MLLASFPQCRVGEMKPFNRERFLFYLLGSVLAVNAVFFGFGLFACSRSDDPAATCPNIGARFDNYSEKALAAVLGLIAGAGAITLTQRRPSSSDDRDESLASQPPLQLQQPSPKDSSQAERPVRDQGQKPERGGRKA